MPKSACRAVAATSGPVMRYRSPQGHLPLVQIGSVGRVLQRVHRAGCLVGAEHRTAPAARADRLDAALAQLLDGGAVLHGDRVSYRETTGQPPARVPPPGARAREVTSLASWPVSRVPAQMMTSQGPATPAVSQTPGTSRTAAVTTAAGPAWACTGMCEAIT